MYFHVKQRRYFEDKKKHTGFGKESLIILSNFNEIVKM